MDELITKRDAIEAVNDVLAEYIPILMPWQERIPLECALKLKALPPVQAEPLTDREQRIFLAAMSREKEVCKEVDYQFSDAREPYEDTLVSVCKEIERKVKAALWKN